MVSRAKKKISDNWSWTIDRWEFIRKNSKRKIFNRLLMVVFLNRFHWSLFAFFSNIFSHRLAVPLTTDHSTYNLLFLSATGRSPFFFSSLFRKVCFVCNFFSKKKSCLIFSLLFSTRNQGHWGARSHNDRWGSAREEGGSIANRFFVSAWWNHWKTEK